MKIKKLKKRDLIILIFILMISISVITYYAVDLANFYKNYDINCCLEDYEKDPSNQNLIALCLELAVKNDIRLLEYVDNYLGMENFNSETRQYEQSIMSDEEIDFCHDFMITSVFRICAQNNNLDLFMESLNKYYPQIRNKDKLFFLSLANKGGYKETKFFKTNAGVIIEYFENIYASTDIPKEKWKTLLIIYTYYSSETVQDFETFKKKHKDELAKLNKQFVNDSNGEDFGYLLGYYSSYWEHLLTGEEKNYWDSALNDKMEKVTTPSDEERA